MSQDPELKELERRLRSNIVKLIFLSAGLILLILGMISGFFWQDAFATSHPRPTFTYYVVENGLTNTTMVKHAADYWLQYGFTMKYSRYHPNTIIEFHPYCMGTVVGEYDTKTHAIDIFTGCYPHAYTFTQKVVTHELGHFLGFEHGSDPPIMKSEIEQP